MPTLTVLLLLLSLYQGLAGIYAVFYWLVPVKFLSTPETSMHKINHALQVMFTPLVMPIHDLLGKKCKSEKIQMGVAILVVFVILWIIRFVLSYFSMSLVVRGVTSLLVNA